MVQPVEKPKDPPAEKFYSLNAIMLATFLGFWFAGAVLISRNYSRLGDGDASRIAIILGILSLIPLAAAYAVIQVPQKYEYLLEPVFLVATLGLINLIGSRLQGRMLSRHEEQGGQFYSNWRAAGISLLIFPFSFGMMTLVASTVSTLVIPPIENIEIWIDAPMVAKTGEPFEIELHVRNKSDNEQTLVDVDIGREYLEGINIDSSDPAFLEREPELGFVSYSYDLPIPPGQEISITFHAHGEARGDYAGDFDFCINHFATCLNNRVLITVE